MDSETAHNLLQRSITDSVKQKWWSRGNNKSEIRFTRASLKTGTGLIRNGIITDCEFHQGVLHEKKIPTTAIYTFILSTSGSLNCC